ncbi:MAG: 1-deoxy-D-xylulose-5-phosphate synthase [Deltaproteobacteria bacterium]|nr:1-deoxy-D-xylulose-5-phosphate synthase [Deltaproteobacteria bacterium]
MRDAFFNTLFPFAKEDPSIMVLTSDFSAPSFDRYRTDLPGQFINTGISEQNTVLVASGLAMSGMKVFVVSIAPFITMRCFEQIRLFPADMNLNVTIVGVGAGFSYTEAGATHHSVEDIGLMRLLPHMLVFSASDNAEVRHFVHRILDTGGPSYVRLDRRSLPDLYPQDTTFGNSLSVLSPVSKVNFLTTGYTTHLAVELASTLRDNGITVGIVDAFSLPLDPREFAETFGGAELIVSLEEHVASGGLGEAARLLLAECDAAMRLKAFALNVREGLCHSYGPRSALQARHGLDKEDILREVRGFYER